MIDEKVLEGHIQLAEKGKKVWQEIDVAFDADLYVLLPHVADVYNYYALLHIEQYLEAKGAKKVVLLFSEEVIAKALPLFCQREVLTHELSSADIDALLKYYALFEFTSRLTIVSLTRPYDTCAENLLGVHGVTKEDLLCYDIFHFTETPWKNAPAYDGKDKDIIDFLALGRQGQDV